MNRILSRTILFVLFSWLILSPGQTNEREDAENLTVSSSGIAEALSPSEEDQILEAKAYFKFDLPENFITRDSLKNICLDSLTKKIGFETLSDYLLDRLPEELCESVLQGMSHKRVLELWRYVNQLQGDKEKRELLLNKIPLGLDYKCPHEVELQEEGFTTEEIFNGPFRRISVTKAAAFRHLQLLKYNTHLVELHLCNMCYELSPKETDEIFRSVIIALAKHPTLQRIYWFGEVFTDPNTFVAIVPTLASFWPDRQILFDSQNLKLIKDSQVLKMIKVILESSFDKVVLLRVLDLLRASSRPENNCGLEISEIFKYGLDLYRLLELNFNYFIIDCVLDNSTLDILASHCNLRGLCLRSPSYAVADSTLRNLIEVCKINKNIEYFQFDPFYFRFHTFIVKSQLNNIIELANNLNNNPNFKKLELSGNALPYMLTLRDAFKEEHHSDIRNDLTQQLQRLPFDTADWQAEGYTLAEIMDLQPQRIKFSYGQLSAEEILSFQDRTHLQELEFYSPLTDNDSLQSVTQVIGSLPYLTSLKCKLYGYEYDLQIFEHFMATVCSHVNLKALSVTCDGAPIEYKRVLERATKARLLAEGIAE